MKNLVNLTESIRQRLLNRAKNENRSFNELLQYYSMERFLYRLSISKHAQDFILKGALMLRVWNSPEIRPTMDIDMLGKTSNEAAVIVKKMKEIMNLKDETDGLSFDSDSIKTEPITEDAEYEGIRVRFNALLGKIKIVIQIDIGFGDVVYPKPEKCKLPTMLGNPAPILLCYSRESAIAEKFHAMVKLGHFNSRMKDFYDIWMLSRHFSFEKEHLAKAIMMTFENKGTVIPSEIEAFGKDFINSKEVLWRAFRKRINQENTPETFEEIVKTIKQFISSAIIFKNIKI